MSEYQYQFAGKQIHFSGRHSNMWMFNSAVVCQECKYFYIVICNAISFLDSSPIHFTQRMYSFQALILHTEMNPSFHISSTLTKGRYNYFTLSSILYWYWWDWYMRHTKFCFFFYIRLPDKCSNWCSDILLFKSFYDLKEWIVNLWNICVSGGMESNSIAVLTPLLTVV